MQGRHKDLGILAGVTLVYFLLARLGLLLATINPNASPIWPAAGFAVGACIYAGRWAVLAVGLGAFLANYLTNIPFISLVTIALGNSLEAWLSWKTYSFLRKRQDLLSSQVVSISIIAASFIPTWVGASFGGLGLVLGSIIRYDRFAQTWMTWWIGDSIGILMLLPALRMLRSPKVLWTVFQKFSVWVAITLPLVFAILLFKLGIAHQGIFLLFPVLLLSAALGGEVSINIAAFLVCSLAVIANLKGVGPFHEGSLNDNLVNAHLLLSCFLVSALIIGGMKRAKVLRFASVALVLGWVLSGLVYYSFHHRESERDKDHFESIADRAVLQLLGRVRLYEDLFRSGVGLFEASTSVDRDEWKAFVDTIRVSQRLSGLLGMGVIFKVERDHQTPFIQLQRKTGAPQFEIRDIPQGFGNPYTSQEFDKGLTSYDQKMRYVITYIKPQAPNASVVGIDIRSERMRREAADKAAISGEPTISAPILLIQDRVKRSGLLSFLPLYKKGMNIQSTEDRRKALQGFIYAPIIAENFFNDAFGDLQTEARISVWDVSRDQEGGLFYGVQSTEHDESLTARTLKIWQRDYKMVFERTPNFASAHDVSEAWAGACGAIITLLLALLVANLSSMNQRAQAMASEMSAKVLSQQARLTESARLSSLGEMAAGIAHEINNPLAIIGGRASQLKSLVASKSADSEKVLLGLSKIEETVMRISKIIRGLQAFSRNSETDLMRVVRLESIFESALELCRERFKHREVNIEISIPENLSINCREVQICQVVVNLFNNAYDAVKTLPERWIRVEAHRLGNEIVLSIMDSGTGIDPLIAKRIMDPFFTTKPVGQGTGLGLSISKGIIEEHGGSLELDNHSEHTRFVIRLPEAKVQESRHSIA